MSNNLEEIKDRMSTNPNRKKIKIISQTPNEIIADIERADSPSQTGTPINSNLINNIISEVNSLKNQIGNKMGTSLYKGEESYSTYNLDLLTSKTDFNNLTTVVNNNSTNITTLSNTASNLTTNISEINNKLSMCTMLPSSQSINLNAENGASFTAPANGWYVIYGNPSGSAPAVGWVNETSGLVSVIRKNSSDLGQSIPAKKGDVVTLRYEGGGGVYVCKFIYAEGEN